MSLYVDWPGVQFRAVEDDARAAEHAYNITRALAQEPFKAQVRDLCKGCPNGCSHSSRVWAGRCLRRGWVLV